MTGSVNRQKQFQIQKNQRLLTEIPKGRQTLFCFNFQMQACPIPFSNFINLNNKQKQNYRMYEKSSDEQFEKAVQELQLKVRNDPSDKEQIKYILTEILGYPSVSKAIQHHNSNRLGTNDLLTTQLDIEKKVREKDISDFQICYCCGLLLQNEQLPYTTHLSQLNLGVGVLLFFKDFLYYAFIFSLIFLIYSIYSIATNVIAFNMDQKTKQVLCNQTTSCGFSDIGAGAKVLNHSQVKTGMIVVQEWIGVAIVIMWGIFNIIKTHLEEKFVIDIETKRVSASDFTLMIKNFPKVHLGTTQEECLQLVQNIFTQYYQNQKSKRECPHTYEVVSVNIARTLYMENRRDAQYKERIRNQLHARQDVFRNWIIYRKVHERFPFDYNARSRVYEDYHNYYSEIFEKEIFPRVPLQDKNLIFVTMRHSKAREQIQENNAPMSIFKFWKFFKDSDFPIKDVTIKKAPQPEQIKWNNIGFPKAERVFRRFIAWLATLGLLGASLGISIGISYVKKNVAVSIGISIIITLVNLGIQILLIYFSSLQYEIIQSWEQSSAALKIGICQLVNSIGVPIIVAVVSQEQETPKSWLKANGLADDVFFIALLNLFVPISSLIDPYQLILRAIRWWKNDPNRRLHMFGQKQLNKYYGNYIFDIGYEYVFLIKTSIFTAFFVTMQPIIALFAPFALIFYYFAVKRNLFYHFRRPGYHFQTTNNTVDMILLFSLLAFGLGSLFANAANPEARAQNNPNNGIITIIDIIMIIVACVFLIIVPFRFFYCCISKPEIPNKDYLKKRMLIYNDYDRVNPITKHSAITEFQRYIKGLEEQMGLTDEAQLVKLHVSTIQKRETIKPENTMRQSFSRLSMSIMAEQPSVEPKYNHDLNFYEQIAQEKSQTFGKQKSPTKGQIQRENSMSALHPLSKISESKNQNNSESKFQ